MENNIPKEENNFDIEIGIDNDTEWSAEKLANIEKVVKENAIKRAEFQKNFEENINKMSIDELRAYVIRLNNNSQKYFRSWLKAEEEIEKMEVEISKLKSK